MTADGALSLSLPPDASAERKAAAAAAAAEVFDRHPRSHLHRGLPTGIFTVRDGFPDAQLLTLFANFAERQGFETRGWDNAARHRTEIGLNKREHMIRDTALVHGTRSTGGCCAGVRYTVELSLAVEISPCGGLVRKYARVSYNSRSWVPCINPILSRKYFLSQFLPSFQAELYQSGGGQFGTAFSANGQHEIQATKSGVDLAAAAAALP